MNTDTIITIRLNMHEKVIFDYCMEHYNQRITKSKSSFIKHLIFRTYRELKNDFK